MSAPPKLTLKERDEIRARYVPCPCCGARPGHRTLARQFNVSAATILTVLNEKRKPL